MQALIVQDTVVFALFLTIYFILFTSILCVFTECRSCITGAREAQEKALDHLELELQMVVSCLLGAGN